MESSHFLNISSPWQKLQNVAIRILICCHGNEIWAIFAKITNCFFFVFRWNRAIFWPLVLRDPSTKRCSSIFDLGPLTPKIDSPKFGKKSPITRLVWQIERRCLRLIGGFRDGRFNGTIQNFVGPTLVAMATKIWQIWATFSHKSILLFCLSTESSHFWPSVLHVALYKTLFFDFWIRSPNA